jgi:hypothetical protein
MASIAAFMSAVRRLNVFLAGLFFPFAAFSPFD